MECELGTRGGNDNKVEILKMVYADVWRGPPFVDGANGKSCENRENCVRC